MKLQQFVDIAKELKEVADFAIVYVREAHPTDLWAFDWWKYGNIPSHKTLADRIAAAKILVAELGESGAPHIPVYIDQMSNDVCSSFGAAPERLAVLKNGLVHWIGGPGPEKYNLDEARRALLACAGQ